MSELLSDMKTVLKERVSGPFFGYIFVSFFLFNWDWIYFFIFSSLSAEQKLSTISHTYQYIRGFVYPVISGFTMCLAVPFINVFIKKLHSIAVRVSKEVDYDNDNSLEAIKADRELKNSLKRQKASIIKSDVDKLEKDHQTLHDATLAMRSEVAILTAKSLELRHEEQELTQKINEVTIELQKNNATKENFNRLNDMVEEKSNENIKLSSKINDFETTFNDIAKYMEIRDGSRLESLLLSQKVETFLESYGYKKNKSSVEKTSLGLGSSWVIPTSGSVGEGSLGLGSLLDNSTTENLKKAWEATKHTSTLVGGLQGLAYINSMPAVKMATEISKLGGIAQAQKFSESVGIREASRLVNGSGIREASKLVNPSGIQDASKLVNGFGIREASKLVNGFGIREASKLVGGFGIRKASKLVDDFGATTPRNVTGQLRNTKSTDSENDTKNLLDKE